jgi:hypothetical protein
MGNGTYISGGENPLVPEWLMGFPIGHSAVEPSATPSSRKSRNGSSGKSQRLRKSGDVQAAS